MRNRFKAFTNEYLFIIHPHELDEEYEGGRKKEKKDLKPRWKGKGNEDETCCVRVCFATLADIKFQMQKRSWTTWIWK